MAELTSMPNIGQEMARKLAAVGIGSAEALREIGAEQAFLRLKRAYPQVCLVHLYALEGAAQGGALGCLPPEKRRALKKFSDEAKRCAPSAQK